VSAFIVGDDGIRPFAAAERVRRNVAERNSSFLGRCTYGQVKFAANFVLREQQNYGENGILKLFLCSPL